MPSITVADEGKVADVSALMDQIKALKEQMSMLALLNSTNPSVACKLNCLTLHIFR